MLSKAQFTICLLLVFICSCSRQSDTPLEKPPRSVICWQVEESSIVPKVKVSGLTQPNKTQKLAFRLAGVVDNLPVSLGDTVKKDDILATLEPIDFRLQVLRARQSLALAKSRLVRAKAKGRPEEIKAAEAKIKAKEHSHELANKIYESQRELARSNILSQINFDKLQADAQIAREEVDIAKQDLALLKKGARIEDIQLAAEQVALAQVEVRIAEQNLRYLRLKAPSRGTITSLDIEKGEFTGVGKSVLVIDDLYQIKLQAPVPETQIAQIALEQKVKVTIEALGGEVFEGLVSYIASKADLISKTFIVEILIANPKLKIRAGMFAWVEIQIGVPQSTVLLPPQCLIKDYQGTYVLALTAAPDEKKIAQTVRREIKTGKPVRGLVEVLEGLNGVNWVILEGQHYVTPDSKVFVTATRE